MAQIPYTLKNPPLVASFAAHAAVITATWFECAPRTLEKWPLSAVKVNGKRATDTTETWAMAAAHWPSDDFLEMALARLSEDMADAIRPMVPAAREALKTQKTRAREEAKHRTIERARALQAEIAKPG